MHNGFLTAVIYILVWKSFGTALKSLGHQNLRGMSRKSFMRSPMSTTERSSRRQLSSSLVTSSSSSSSTSRGWLVRAAQSGERAPRAAEPRRQLSLQPAAAPAAPIAANRIVPTSRSGVTSTQNILNQINKSDSQQTVNYIGIKK